LALRVVSPELVLVDPTLLGETRDHASGPGGDTTPEEHMSGETFHVNGSNGASPTPAPAPAAETVDQQPAPSLETVLFKAGLITADQLGEVVLERVQSGRPAGDIVVERGLVSREALAEMLASPSEPAPVLAAVEPAATHEVDHVQPPVAEPALASTAPPAVEPFQPPAVEPVAAQSFEPVPAPAETFAAVAAPAPVAEAIAAPAAAPAPVVETTVVEPATPPAPAVEAQVVEPAPPPFPDVTHVPVQHVAAPVEAPAAVEAAEPVAEAPPPAPAAETQPEPAAPQEPVAMAQQESAAAPDGHGFSMGEVHYGIRIRLAEGVTLDAGSYPSRERAVEAARGIATRLAAEGGEWPLVGDTLVRPEAVLAIEIDSAVSWFASRQA
jgi:hypothetical protein